MDTAPVPRHHPVAGESVYPKEFNHTVGMDALELKDCQGNRYTAFNLVDMGTSLHRIVLVKAGGGNPSETRTKQSKNGSMNSCHRVGTNRLHGVKIGPSACTSVHVMSPNPRRSGWKSTI